jgi:hypothetical protein
MAMLSPETYMELTYGKRWRERLAAATPADRAKAWAQAMAPVLHALPEGYRAPGLAAVLTPTKAVAAMASVARSDDSDDELGGRVYRYTGYPERRLTYGELMGDLAGSVSQEEVDRLRRLRPKGTITLASASHWISINRLR